MSFLQINRSIFLFKALALGALLAAVNAGLYPGYGHAVSSQSIIRHDAGYPALGHATPYAGYYDAAPAYYGGHNEYVRLRTYVHFGKNLVGVPHMWFK